MYVLTHVNTQKRKYKQANKKIETNKNNQFGNSFLFFVHSTRRYLIV